MLKSELIEMNKNLITQNGELMYLLDFGELRCEDSKHQMIWKRDSNAHLLQQENKQLKEELKDEEQWRIKIAKERDELHKECLNHIEQKKLYKEVIEEVRKYMKENRTRYIHQDSLGEDWWFEDLDVYSELSQILDKVKDKQ